MAATFQKALVIASLSAANAVRLDEDEASMDPGSDSLSKAMDNFQAAAKQTQSTVDDPATNAEQGKTAVSTDAGVPAPAPQTGDIDWRVGTMHVDPTGPPTPYPTPAATEYHAKWYFPFPNGDEGRDLKDVREKAADEMHSLRQSTEDTVKSSQATINEFEGKKNAVLSDATLQVQKVNAESKDAIKASEREGEEKVKEIKVKGAQLAVKEQRDFEKDKERVFNREVELMKAVKSKECQDIKRVNQKARMLDEEIANVESRMPPMKKKAEQEYKEVEEEHAVDIKKAKEVAEQVKRNATLAIDELRKQGVLVQDQQKIQLDNAKKVYESELAKETTAQHEVIRLKNDAAVQAQRMKKALARELEEAKDDAEKQAELVKKYSADIGQVKKAEQRAAKIAKHGDKVDELKVEHELKMLKRKKDLAQGEANGLKFEANQIVAKTDARNKKHLQEAKAQLDESVRETRNYEDAAERAKQAAQAEIARIHMRQDAMLDHYKERGEDLESYSEDHMSEAKQKLNEARSHAREEVREAKETARQTVRSVLQEAEEEIKLADNKKRKAQEQVADSAMQAAKELREAKEGSAREFDSFKDSSYMEAKHLANEEQIAQDEHLKAQERSQEHLRDLEVRSREQLHKAEQNLKISQQRARAVESQADHERYVTDHEIYAQERVDKQNAKAAEKRAEYEKERYLDAKHKTELSLRDITRASEDKIRAENRKAQEESHALLGRASAISKEAFGIQNEYKNIREEEKADVLQEEDKAARALEKAREKAKADVEAERLKAQVEEGQESARDQRKADRDVARAKAKAETQYTYDKRTLDYVEKKVHKREQKVEDKVYEAKLMYERRLKERKAVNQHMIEMQEQELEDAKQKSREDVDKAVEAARKKGGGAVARAKAEVAEDLKEAEERAEESRQKESERAVKQKDIDLQKIQENANKEVEQIQKSSDKAVEKYKAATRRSQKDATRKKVEGIRTMHEARVEISRAENSARELEQAGKIREEEARDHLEGLNKNLADKLKEVKANEAEEVENARAEANRDLMTEEDLRDRRMNLKRNSLQEVSELRLEKRKLDQQTRFAQQDAGQNTVEALRYRRQGQLEKAAADHKVAKMENEEQVAKRQTDILKTDQAVLEEQSQRKLHMIKEEAADDIQRIRGNTRSKMLYEQMAIKHAQARANDELKAIERQNQDEIAEFKDRLAAREERMIQQHTLNTQTEVANINRISSSEASRLRNELRAVEGAVRQNKADLQRVSREGDELAYQLQKEGIANVAKVKKERAGEDFENAAYWKDILRTKGQFYRNKYSDQVKGMKENTAMDVKAMQMGLNIHNNNVATIMEGYNTAAGSTAEAVAANAEGIKVATEGAAQKIRAATTAARDETVQINKQTDEVKQEGVEAATNAAKAVIDDIPLKMAPKVREANQATQKTQKDIKEFRVVEEEKRKEKEMGWRMEDAIAEAR